MAQAPQIAQLCALAVDGLLPDDFYALVEQHWGKYGPDVLTLEGPVESNDSFREEISGGGLALLTKPRRKATAEGDLNYYRQKRKTLTVRHVSDDRVIAMIEIVSPGNKAGTQAFDEFIEKAAFLIDRRIHLVVVDLFPPTKRDPQVIHGAIWEAITGEEYRLPKRKPLTVASYEAVSVCVPSSNISRSNNSCPIRRCSSNPTAALTCRWKRHMNARPRQYRSVGVM